MPPQNIAEFAILQNLSNAIIMDDYKSSGVQSGIINAA
jgi:hypothetical protein